MPWNMVFEHHILAQIFQLCFWKLVCPLSVIKNTKRMGGRTQGARANFKEKKTITGTGQNCTYTLWSLSHLAIAFSWIIKRLPGSVLMATLTSTVSPFSYVNVINTCFQDAIWQQRSRKRRISDTNQRRSDGFVWSEAFGFILSKGGICMAVPPCPRARRDKDWHPSPFL